MSVMSQSSTNIQVVIELPSYAPQAAAHTQVTVGQATVADDSIYEDIDGVQVSQQANQVSICLCYNCLLYTRNDAL